MAVDDLSRETDAFVLPSKSYYPVKIPINHFQLRHFISSPEPDLLYYASGADVFCLNVATKTQAHVTTLPWEARCTSSGYGYVCVGGEKEGHFAAIKVAGFPPTNPTDVDALLPLDLTRRTTVPRAPSLGAAHHVRLEKVGKDIVNSISIHKDSREGQEDEVFAVLTNNDTTVRIYSLTRNVEEACLHLPFPMNHATVSPDGTLLVAVGDKSMGFFFDRTECLKASSSKSPGGEAGFNAHKWQLLDHVRLYVPAAATGARSCEGYFTTAWSPCGRLCAVGSECGYITVFDTEELRMGQFGEDAIAYQISSTRPGISHGPGAVRTMMFSPAPWDLLIWGEDQARVCVADLRAGLKVKQVLTLDTEEKGLERVAIADFDFSLSPEINALRREADFIRRYRRTLDTQGSVAAGNLASVYLEGAIERRRRHRQLGIVDSDDDPHGLTEQERQIIEAPPSTRAREERERQTTPRSINYYTSSPAETLAQTGSADGFPALRSNTRAGQREAPLGSEGSAEARLSQLLRGARDNHRSLLRAHEELSGGSSTGEGSDGPESRSQRLLAAQLRRVEYHISPTEDAWRTIEIALDQRNTHDGQWDNRRRTTAMQERLRNVQEDYRPRRTGLRVHDPSVGVLTAGLAMSEDGRTLYCGTVDGIFEFNINLQERKAFPAITPR
ncbi:hypothetical protein M011DRAFT_339600 [Sporormia fimetaria CBS 119925]|uniref:DUF2415 domain-containing protein n=1 Tax=Sporormia fimetaria CBS 119925 TaxID=1340428 RepID=A0A6A6VGE4_9PLEO|nr:hypothetical protein M011DRAFT_339600 [Sporormia fimetaria CBS 119925]